MKLRLIPIICVAACGGGSGPTNAEALDALSTVTSELAGLQSVAIDASGSGSDVLAYSGACEGGGSASIHGAYQGEENFDLVAAFDACDTGAGIITGGPPGLSWSENALQLNGTLQVITGSIEYSASGDSFVCDFDLAVLVRISDGDGGGPPPGTIEGSMYTGSACGYAVDLNVPL